MSVNSSYEYSATARSLTFASNDPTSLFVAGFNGTNEALHLDISSPQATLVRSFSTGNNNAYSLALSPDDQKLAVGAADNKIHLYNISTGFEFATKSAHTGIINSLDWSPDGLTFASAGADGKLILWGDRTPPVATAFSLSASTLNLLNRQLSVSIRFNESMDTSILPTVTAGALPNASTLPLTGAWVNSKTWNGSVTFPVASNDGQNWVRITGTRDLSGNPHAGGFSPGPITVDTQPPDCHVPPLPVFVNTTTVAVLSNATDPAPASGIANVEFVFRNSTAGPWSFGNDTTAPFSQNLTFGADDSYYFSNRCWDVAGNLYDNAGATREGNTTLDTAAPTSKVAPIDAKIPTWNFTVDANGGDTGSGLLAIELWWRKDGGGWQGPLADGTFPYQWKFDALPYGQGLYEFTSRARDVAGNREAQRPGNDSWVIVDLGLPETEMTPLPAAMKNRAINLATRITRPADGVSSISFEVDDGTGWRSIQNDSRTSALFNAPGDGCFAFRTIARTLLGRVEPAPLTNDTRTCVDSIPPRVLSTDPANSTTSVASTSDLKFVFSESITTASLSVIVNLQTLPASTNWTAGDTIVNLHPAKAFPTGTNIAVVASFEDPAGNQGVHYFEFTTWDGTPGTGNLRIRVSDRAGKPLAEAQVVITLQGGIPVQKPSGAGGEALFTGLVPGTYEVKATKAGYREEKLNVAVVAGAEVNRTLNLAAEAGPEGPPTFGTTGLALLVLLIVLAAAVVAIIVSRRKRPFPEARSLPGNSTALPGRATRRPKSAPAAPTLKIVASKIPKSVKLEWESFPNDEGYVIYHKTGGAGSEPPKAEALEKLIVLPKGTGSYVHEDLQAPSEHWYSLALKYATGSESPRSKPVKADVRAGSSEK